MAWRQRLVAFLTQLIQEFTSAAPLKSPYVIVMETLAELHRLRNTELQHNPDFIAIVDSFVASLVSYSSDESWSTFTERCWCFKALNSYRKYLC